jgi:hypothetical protein
MKTIKTFDYKGFPVELTMSEHMGITFSCSSYNFKSKHRKAHINGGWEKPEEAINSIKEVIDEFLKHTPKTYDELADTIYADALIWTGYEDCHIEPIILKQIVEKFLLTQKK